MTWRKLPDSHSKLNHKGGTYEHLTGWQIEHCGHPTALFPYYLITPNGEHPIIGCNCRAFRNLDAAKAAVAYILCGLSRVVTDEHGHGVVDNVTCAGRRLEVNP